MNFVVYILYSPSLDRFYIGETPDLNNRLMWHNDPTLNTNSTKVGIPWKVFFTINCASRTQARQIEKHIKRMKSRVYIQNLIKYPDMTSKLLLKYQ